LKRRKEIIVITTILVCLLTSSVILSSQKFATPNPVMSGIGIVKIMFAKEEIVQIRKHPQVYLAKPDNAQQLLVDFMEQSGYSYLENERLASILVFGNGVSIYYVEFSVNAYYSKWVFIE